MKNPKSLKQAIESGSWIVKSIYKKGSKKCRVDVSPRFFRSGMKPIIGFWLTSDYVKRTYPNIYERN